MGAQLSRNTRGKDTCGVFCVNSIQTLHTHTQAVLTLAPHTLTTYPTLPLFP